jgi:CubicO group peptidase (beta-lactamase class C family)
MIAAMPAFDAALRSLDDSFRAFQAERRIPGLAWGVVRGGSLVHASGIGTLRDGEDRVPDADSVFRIASMTKSFTAAVILLLRDEGRLRLDDPVADHVPALDGWGAPTADAGPITIRQLLTMSAGLPTDDAWADRQQSMPADVFDALLRQRPPVAWTPGTIFEYSNLGYAILGRVITNVAGAEYRDVVRHRLLVPLGLTASSWDEDEVPGERLAHGYVRRGETLVREGRDGYGVFASMGGLYSSVGDLARWVAGFLDAVPARDDPEGGHPLRRASRREMQQVHQALGVEVDAHLAHEGPTVAPEGYGFGLVATSRPDVGITVSHGGGYPGFGSYMVWHPSSGIGIVGLANLRYAGPRDLANAELARLVRAEGVRRRRVRPSPSTDPLRADVASLLTAWDDTVADRVFAMNVDLDEPLADRRAAIEAAVAQIAPLEPDPDRPDESWSPASVAWWLRGSGGWLRVELTANPEPRPRIQSFAVRAVPHPSPALATAATAIAAATVDAAHVWPADVARDPALDVATVDRSLAAAAARFGALTLGLPVEGDGQATMTWELWPVATAADATRTRLAGGRAPATLVVAVDAAGGVRTANILVAPLEAPYEQW